MVSEGTLAVGRAAMAGLLGVDALYRSESGDGEGLAVLNMDTEGTYAPASFAGYADARSFFEELRREAAALPEADRRRYYDQLCHSTLAFIAWRTRGLSFGDQLRDFLHVPVAPASDGELDALRGELKRLLDAMGYDGDLAAQCAAWEERNRVPADAVPSVLTDLLDEAWSRTEERVVVIPAARSDGMRVSAVRGVAYNARCDYLNRTIELNVDPVLTRPALKHLAVHEGYPGHYVQFKLRETWARAGAAPADALLATNTSSLSVTEIAAAAKDPARVLGMHFFNPPYVLKLLEIVRAQQTSDEAVERAQALGERMGREMIVVADSPGFATSRLGLVIGLEAMRMLQEGVASAEDIDRAMELGYRHPMGPLKLTDLVGLDVRLDIAEYLHRELGGEQFRPPPILRRLVRAGKLGKKTGEGFYRW